MEENRKEDVMEQEEQETAREMTDGETTEDPEPEADIGPEDPAESAEGPGEAQEDVDPEPSEPAGETPKRGFFKKKKDKRDTQIEELTDRVQRQMAEFDNFRKRTEKEKAAMFETGAKSVIEKILPTIDNFERGLGGLTDEQKNDPFVQGMEKVYRQLLTTLEGIGVTPIEAVGKPFDPNFHNAVMHVEDEETEENIVVEEFQKGYLYRDSVVRHSMVKVAN